MHRQLWADGSDGCTAMGEAQHCGLWWGASNVTTSVSQRDGFMSAQMALVFNRFVCKGIGESGGAFIRS